MKKKLNWSTASAWDQYAYGADQGNWNLCRAVCNGAGCGLGVPEDQLPGYTPAESKIWWEMFRVACSPGCTKEWGLQRTVDACGQTVISVRMLDIPLLLAAMAASLARFSAPLVRVLVRVMPIFAREWRWVSSLGLMSHAKALRRDFDAMGSECDEIGYRLAREGATVILKRLIIRHPNKDVERAKWRSFLSHIVVAADDGGDVAGARAVMDLPEFVEPRRISMVPGSVSFGPMEASVTVKVKSPPRLWGNPIKWMLWKITKSTSHLIG